MSDMRRQRAFIGGLAIGVIGITLTFGAAAALDVDGGRIQVFDVQIGAGRALPTPILWEGAVSLPSDASTPSASVAQTPSPLATPAATPEVVLASPTPTAVPAPPEEGTPAPALTPTLAPTPTAMPTPSEEGTPASTPTPSESPVPSG